MGVRISSGLNTVLPFLQAQGAFCVPASRGQPARDRVAELRAHVPHAHGVPAADGAGQAAGPAGGGVCTALLRRDDHPVTRAAAEGPADCAREEGRGGQVGAGPGKTALARVPGEANAVICLLFSSPWGDFLLEAVEGPADGPREEGGGGQGGIGSGEAALAQVPGVQIANYLSVLFYAVPQIPARKRISSPVSKGAGTPEGTAVAQVWAGQTCILF
jgi:hypothetical protein